MLRGVLGATAATAALALGVLPGSVPPASAGDNVDTLPVHPEWGTVTGIDGRLQKGCKAYNYTYAVDPPEGIWAIEFFVTDPNGAALSNGASLDGFDPLSGTMVFKICRNTTVPGIFTIRAKVSADDGFGNITEGQLPPDTFTLTRKAKEVWAEQPL